MPSFSRTRWFLIALAVVSVSAAVPSGPRQPDDGSRCQVCGMLVATHADWLAQVVAENGETHFFDGAKDLFRFLIDPEFEGSRATMSEAMGIYVTSYYERESIDARAALFVVGSEVLGPMGAELVPHPTREAAEEFARDHGGTVIVTFDEVTADLLAGLR
jgi:copper chaperone NosL